MSKEKIAIVGSGVAGLTAAYILDKKYDVTLFEKNDYIGGHTHTIEVDDGIPVDTGFIVMNHRNYPYFTKLLKEIDIDLQDSNMSFGHYDEEQDFYYNTDSLKGLFAQKKNIVSYSFYKMLYEITRFFKLANRDLESNNIAEITLGEYLEANEMDQGFIDNYLIPMGAAIWSTPTAKMMDFPARSFLNFYRNHGLLSINDQPQWRTVKGGSCAYVQRILELISATVLHTDPVVSISRPNGKVEVHCHSGRRDIFDKVIIATHADEAISLIKDPSSDESRLLSPWEYSKNETYLHSDDELLPTNKAAWASWNFRRTGDQLTLTYFMNKLQNLSCKKNYFVTLNPHAEPKNIHEKMTYTHPIFDSTSLATQSELPNLSGINNTYFCGSYHGNGFHEDAVRSSVEICKKLGVEF